jgi:DNA-binding GntR family transcriptional regulator
VAKRRLSVTLDPVTLDEQVYRILRDRILHWELGPGQRLDIDELSQSFGVSRTPIKNAFNRLSVEGLVDIHPRRGTFVTHFKRKDLEELIDVRMMVELHSVEACLRKATPEDDVRLRRILEKMRTYIVDDGYNDYQAFLVQDWQLHSYFVELAGNSQLMKIFAGNKLNIQLARACLLTPIGDAAAAYREHSEILNAFERRSSEGLKVAIQQHENNRRAHLSKLMKE